MAEETQIPQVDDTLTHDDMDMLRAVLEDEHSRGMTAVSVYNQAAMFVEDFE